MTADTALRLARYFGTTPQVWLNLQQTYELRRAEIGSSERSPGAGSAVRGNMTGDGPQIVIEGRREDWPGGARGGRLVDVLLAWLTPDRQLEPELNRFQVR